MTAPMPATFYSLDSYIRTTSDAGGSAFRVKFEFRTHDEDGILLFHEFQAGGSIKVSQSKNEKKTINNQCVLSQQSNIER